MKIVFAVLTAASVLTGCVVPVARPVGYGGPPIYGGAGVGAYGPGIVYNQPIVVAPPRYSPLGPPVYLHVPPEHHRDWRQHCDRYSACDRPVYFVREPGPRPPPTQHVPPGYSVPVAPVGPGSDRRQWVPGSHPPYDPGRRDDRYRGDEHRERGERGDRMPGPRPLTPGDPRTR